MKIPYKNIIKNNRDVNICLIKIPYYSLHNNRSKKSNADEQNNHESESY